MMPFGLVVFAKLSTLPISFLINVSGSQDLIYGGNSDRTNKNRAELEEYFDSQNLSRIYYQLLILNNLIVKMV